MLDLHGTFRDFFDALGSFLSDILSGVFEFLTTLLDNIQVIVN